MTHMRLKEVTGRRTRGNSPANSRQSMEGGILPTCMQALKTQTSTNEPIKVTPSTMGTTWEEHERYLHTLKCVLNTCFNEPCDLPELLYHHVDNICDLTKSKMTSVVTLAFELLEKICRKKYVTRHDKIIPSIMDVIRDSGGSLVQEMAESVLQTVVSYCDHEMVILGLIDGCYSSSHLIRKVCSSRLVNYLEFKKLTYDDSIAELSQMLLSEADPITRSNGSMLQYYVERTLSDHSLKRIKWKMKQSEFAMKQLRRKPTSSAIRQIRIPWKY